MTAPRTLEQRLRANLRESSITRGAAFKVAKVRGGFLFRFVSRPGHRKGRLSDPSQPVEVWASTLLKALHLARVALFKEWPRQTGAPLGNRNRASGAARGRRERLEQEEARRAGDDMVLNP